MGMGAGRRANVSASTTAGGGAKGFRIAGACLLVVAAFGVACASAGAATGFPGYVRCFKTEKVGKAYAGEYTEKACQTKASPAKTGKYEVQVVDSGTYEAV